MTTLQAQAEAFRFGKFVLKPHRRLLLADGVPVPLSSRAYDILEMLVRCHERVVSRDELVAHVWRGTVVGEGNLTVQMSTLRRVLGDHAGGEPLIVNLPGRGYRLVAEVSLGCPGVATPLAISPVPAPDMSAIAPPRRLALGGLRVVVLAVLIALPLLLLAGTAARRHQDRDSAIWSSLPESRLSIATHPLVPVGDDSHTAITAARYTDLLLSQLSQFEDLLLLVDAGPHRQAVMTHFELNGSVHINGAMAVIQIILTETGSGRLLYRNDAVVPIAAAKFEDKAAAMDLVTELRPRLFQVEAERRRRPPRDALDFIIDAHVALGQFEQVSEVERALPLAEQAVRIEPTSRPAKALLALILFDHMIASSAVRGDAEGWRALTLIEEALRGRPRDCLYISLRAHILMALGRLDDAQATAELGLQTDPGDAELTAELGEIMLLKGDLVSAKSLLQSDPSDLQDDTLATIAFAEARYAEAMEMSRRVVAATPDGFWTQFPLLLEIASLSRLGRVDEARTVLQTNIQRIPQDFRVFGALRRTAYVLPEDAWRHFRAGLADAGMPP